MKIVVDTNALYADWELDSAHARLLLVANRAGEVHVVVPEVVVLETAGLYGRGLEEASRAHEKLRRELHALGVEVDPLALEVERSVTDYERRLRQKLADAGVRVPPPPDVSHLDVVKRAIARKNPFDMKGRGYRDTLIWQHVLTEAADDQVVLVTSNASDFAKPKEPRVLADELVQELESHGIARDAVLIELTMRDAVRTHVESSPSALRRVLEALGDAWFAAALYEAVNEDLLYREVSNVDDADLNRMDVHEIRIDGVHELRDVEVDDAYEDGDAITFNFGATVEVEAEFFAHKYEAYADDDVETLITDWDWNESMVRGTTTVELAVEGWGEYNADEPSLSAHVTLVH